MGLCSKPSDCRCPLLRTPALAGVANPHRALCSSSHLGLGFLSLPLVSRRLLANPGLGSTGDLWLLCVCTGKSKHECLFTSVERALSAVVSVCFQVPDAGPVCPAGTLLRSAAGG